MTALLITGIIALTVMLSLSVSVAVILRQALQKSLDHADKIHARAQAHLDKTLDRLMAVDYASFKSWQVTEQEVDGGFVAPDEQEGATVHVERPVQWGVRLPEYDDSGSDFIEEDLSAENR